MRAVQNTILPATGYGAVALYKTSMRPHRSFVMLVGLAMGATAALKTAVRLRYFAVSEGR